MVDCYEALSRRGFVRMDGRLDAEDAFTFGRELIDRCCAHDGSGSLEIIGDFVLPPSDGRETRDFQTLHIDFGLPLDPRVAQDVARYTALYVPAGTGKVSASTRLVPMVALLGQRAWPPPAELIRRFVAYGRSHGAWDDDSGYVEGSFARIVEAAAGLSPALPSVTADPDFLCGLEFESLRAELAFFERHGLRIAEAEVEVALQPGELLVFDNLALAHGRRGIRRPGELRQRVFGHRSLSPIAQRVVRDRVLSAFHPFERGKPDGVPSFSTP